MSTTQALEKTKKENEVSYVPFAAADPIKLSIGIIRNLVCVPTKKGTLCSDADAIKFMALCSAQRLNPFSGDCFLTGYETQNGPRFSMIVAHVALMKRAEACKEYEGMESGVIIKQEDGSLLEREGDFVMPEEVVVGGWARVYRTGRRPTYRRLSVAQRKPPYESSFWSKDKLPEQICKCSEASALRDTFPSLCGGIYTGAEIIEIAARPSLEEASSPRLFTQIGAPQAPPAEQKPEPKPPGPEPDPAAQQPGPAEKTKSGHDTLKEFVLEECKVSFDLLQKYLVESNMFPGADSCANWDDLPNDIVARCLRAKSGLKMNLGKTADLLNK